jgi:hypothetical protein
MKTKQPTTELKNLFAELVSLTTRETNRRDWAIIRWKSMVPFNQFSLIELMS